MDKCKPDVVQLALQESMDTDVYREAKSVVAQRMVKGKIYFEWW